jgi:hypothetical protein
LEEKVMRGRGFVAVLIGVLAIAAVGAGCGGGESDATAGDQLSKAVYLKKADAVCLRNWEEVKNDYNKFVKAHGGRDVAFDDIDSITEYVDTVVIPNKEQLLDELREVGTPSGGEEKVNAILAAYEEGIDVAEEDPERAAVGEGVFWYAADLAQKYDLRNCRT